MLRIRSAIAAAVAAVAIAVSAPASAQAVDFSGRTIEWWMPFSEGGGSDVWARFFAPYLSRHLPGNPSVIVRNVPGGGSITGTNEFAARARPNGLQLIGTSASTLFPYLLGDRRVRYDFSQLQPVLISPTGGVVYVSSALGIQDAAGLATLEGRELVYASQGATSLDMVPMLAYEVLGLNVRHVFGMTGRGDGRLAFERGEATIDFQTSSAYLTNVAPMAESGAVVPLFSLGVLDAEGNLQRDPTFPDIPHFLEAYEMMHGEAPSGLAYEAYMAFFSSGFAAQKMAMLPAGTPEPIVQAYREAFAAAVNDPELIANAGEILGAYHQAVDAEVPGLYGIATTISPSARDWVRDYLQTRHSVSFN